MISVVIYINSRVLYTRTALNISTEKDLYDKKAINTYRVDTGKIIKHYRKDGAVKLVRKMLNTIKE